MQLTRILPQIFARSRRCAPTKKLALRKEEVISNAECEVLRSQRPAPRNGARNCCENENRNANWILRKVALQDDDACETFAAILENHADYRRLDRVLYELAWVLKSTGQAQAAGQRFTRIAQHFPESGLAAEANYHVAENHYQEKKYARAIEHYTIAAAKSTSTDIGEKVAYKLGWSHFQLAAYEPALASFRTQVGKFPQGELVADGRFMIGECLFKSGQHKQALQAYEEVPVNELAEKSRVLSQLHAGQAAAQLKRWEDAIRLLSPILSANQNSPFVLQTSYELARAHHNLNQNKRAEERLTPATRSAGSSAQAHSNRKVLSGNMPVCPPTCSSSFS